MCFRDRCVRDGLVTDGCIGTVLFTGCVFGLDLLGMGVLGSVWPALWLEAPS